MTKKKVRKCRMKACENQAVVRGMCRSHYAVWYRKTVKPTKNEFHVTCAVLTCNREAYIRGWCSAHYHRWLNYGADPERGSVIESKKRA